MIWSPGGCRLIRGPETYLKLAVSLGGSECGNNDFDVTGSEGRCLSSGFGSFVSHDSLI